MGAEQSQLHEYDKAQVAVQSSDQLPLESNPVNAVNNANTLQVVVDKLDPDHTQSIQLNTPLPFGEAQNLQETVPFDVANLSISSAPQNRPLLQSQLMPFFQLAPFNPEETGLHVLQVATLSPAAEVGLQPYFDVIVRIQSIPCTPHDPWLQAVQSHVDRHLVLDIYSLRTESLRQVTMAPSRTWQGSFSASQLLGCTVRYCTPAKVLPVLWHVLDVYEQSPASIAGLEAHTDYILGCLDVSLTKEEDLYDLLRQSLNKPVRLLIFNAEREVCRVVQVTPKERWGGPGILGCGIGYGLLHRLPAPKENQGKAEISIQPTQNVTVPSQPMAAATSAPVSIAPPVLKQVNQTNQSVAPFLVNPPQPPSVSMPVNDSTPESSFFVPAAVPIMTHLHHHSSRFTSESTNHAVHNEFIDSHRSASPIKSLNTQPVYNIPGKDTSSVSLHGVDHYEPVALESHNETSVEVPKPLAISALGISVTPNVVPRNPSPVKASSPISSSSPVQLISANTATPLPLTSVSPPLATQMTLQSPSSNMIAPVPVAHQAVPISSPPKSSSSVTSPTSSTRVTVQPLPQGLFDRPPSTSKTGSAAAQALAAMQRLAALNDPQRPPRPSVSSTSLNNPLKALMETAARVQQQAERSAPISSRSTTPGPS